MRSAALHAATAVLAVWAASARAAEPSPATADTAAAKSAAAAVPPSPVTVSQLTDLGLENVSVGASGSMPVIAYENRRYRHTVEVLGRLEDRVPRPFVAIERRLGLASAAITTDATPGEPRFSIRYPSDPDFPRLPRERVAAPTSHSLDVLVGPLLGYELGRLSKPVQVQLDLEPRLRYNPWPGTRITTSLVIPVYSDFEPNVDHPDLDRWRPGLVTVEQFAWLPRLALTSATVGLFGDNRYGFSVGAARPMWQGAVLLDTQVDLTGFVAFMQDGVHYSSASQWTSFAGVTYRPPFWDVAIRGRVASFLLGDRGEELEVRRSLGDVDLAFYTLRTESHSIKGVRLTLPVPPMTRSTGGRLRAQPIERFPFSYRTDSDPIGVYVTGVASREDYLRQLNRPALEANRYRNLPDPDRSESEGPMDWISMSGMTGFINTPWADVIQDRAIELGFSHTPKAWAYDQRGRFVNEAYSAAVGIFPHVEVGLRFTREPGKPGYDLAPVSNLNTDTDHMASGRLTLLTPRPGRPGLAIGVDDVEGTRRFHSTYGVAGLPFSIKGVQSRLSLGYAPSVFTAARHVLDGTFGAFEISPWRVVAARVEYDSEKWNAGIGVGLGYGLRLHVAALNLESVGVGAGWHHKL